MRELPADTTPEADALWRAIVLQRGGGERVRMACEMFQAARRLVVASLPPHIAGDPVERRVALLTRTYSHDLAPDLLQRIVAEIREKT